MKRSGKKGQISFGWIFAILAGGAILFLAIFGAMKTSDTARFQSDTEIAKSISVLIDPLQSGFSEGSFGSISFKKDTKINNVCFSENFGRNDISVAIKSDIGQEWNEAGATISIYNKYIFSSERNIGKKYYVFSKPFEFPYKISDLTFLISNNYCFVDAPEDIQEEVLAFKIPNIQLENCNLSNQIKVCFRSGFDCDLLVSGECDDNCESEFDKGKIKSEDSTKDIRYVSKSLMYAGIFSDERNYDCNVKRLLYRAEKIADELLEKVDRMDARGFSTSLKTDLVEWKSELKKLDSSKIDSLYSKLLEFKEINEKEIRGLW